MLLCINDIQYFLFFVVYIKYTRSLRGFFFHRKIYSILFLVVLYSVHFSFFSTDSWTISAMRIKLMAFLYEFLIKIYLRNNGV